VSEKHIVVAFRVDEELAEMLDLMKERMRVPRSQLIREAVYAYAKRKTGRKRG
jgi:predicted transcriptional regulator